jgi:hypothetical protein
LSSLWISVLLVLIGSGILSGCVSHVQSGHSFRYSGQHAIALEHYASALHSNPGNQEAAKAFKITFLKYTRYLRKKIERADKDKKPLFALKLSTELFDYALWLKQNKKIGRGIQLDLKALNKQMNRLIKQFIRTGFRDLQARLGRGRVLKSDLTFCHQLEALQNQVKKGRKKYKNSGSNESINECEFLLRKFKWYAHFQLSTPPPFTHKVLYNQLQRQLNHKKLEFLSLVDSKSAQHNADLKLEIGQVYQEKTPWFLVHRKAEHVWVQRGNPLVPLWKQEPIRYRFYERHRTLYIPYRLHVVDLKTGKQVILIEEQIQVSETFKASEYQGSRDLYNANIPNRWGYPLQRRSQKLSSPFDVALKSQSFLISEIIKRMNYVFN